MQAATKNNAKNDDYRRYTLLNLIFAASTTLVTVILPLYLRHLGYTDVQLGLVYAAYSLAIILFLPTVGSIADHLGKKLVLLLCMAAELAAIALYAFGGSPATIIIARMVEAVATTTLMVLSLAKAQHHAGRHDGGLKSGSFLSIDEIGRVFIAPAAVFLADYFFLRMPFLVAAVLLLVTLFLLFDRKKFHIRSMDGARISLPAALRAFFSDRQLRGMAVLGVASHASGPVIRIFLPLFIVEQLHAPLLYVGYAIFLLEAPSLLQFAFGKLADRYGPERLVLCGLALFGIGLAGLVVVKTVTALFILLFVAGIGAAMWNVSAWHLMSRVGKKMRKEGTVFTSYLGVAQTGALAASIASGVLVAALTFNGLALASGMLILAACGAAWGLVMKKRRAVN